MEAFIIGPFHAVGYIHVDVFFQFLWRKAV